MPPYKMGDSSPPALVPEVVIQDNLCTSMHVLTIQSPRRLAQRADISTLYPFEVRWHPIQRISPKTTASRVATCLCVRRFICLFQLSLPTTEARHLVFLLNVKREDCSL